MKTKGTIIVENNPIEYEVDDSGTIWIRKNNSLLNIGQTKPVIDLSNIDQIVYQIVKRSGIFINNQKSPN